MQPGKQHIAQPLPGEPGFVGTGEGKNVLLRHRVVLEDIVSGSNMPAGVAVSEQPLSTAAENQPEKQRPEEKLRQGWREHAGPTIGWFCCNGRGRENLHITR